MNRAESAGNHTAFQPQAERPPPRSAMVALRVRRDKAALSSGCESHPARSLQPEATGAVMEVTKWLKPSV